MTTSKVSAHVAAPIVSYLGPSAADFRPSPDNSNDVFLTFEWEREDDALSPSLFPLKDPNLQDRRQSRLPAPTEMAGYTDIIEVLSLAEAYFDDCSYEHAITCLNHIVERTPHNTCALLLRGECYRAQKKHLEAIDDYNMVLEWGGMSECDDARLFIAACLLALGEDEQALAHLDRAVEGTQSSDAYALRGQVLAKLGDRTRAQQDLLRAEEITSVETLPIRTLQTLLNSMI